MHAVYRQGRVAARSVARWGKKAKGDNTGETAERGSAGTLLSCCQLASSSAGKRYVLPVCSALSAFLSFPYDGIPAVAQRGTKLTWTQGCEEARRKRANSRAGKGEWEVVAQLVGSLLRLSVDESGDCTSDRVSVVLRCPRGISCGRYRLPLLVPPPLHPSLWLVGWLSKRSEIPRRG